MSFIELIGPDLNVEVELGLYSDSTPFVKIPDFESVVKNVNTMLVKAESLNTFMAAMFLVDSITARGGHIKNLILPYVPGARQDRINPTGDVLLTAGSVTGIINGKGFDKVLILDPHSDTTPRMLSNSWAFDAGWILEGFWKGYTAVVAPDKGAKDRAEAAAHELEMPIIYGSKVRDVSTGKLSGFEIDVTPGAHYLLVDDICDGGGTFIGLGEKIREQGAFADLYVTHGIFSKGTDALLKIFKNVYTTDSLTRNNGGVYTIPVIERMKKYV